jgi:hypothetical protein
MGHPKFKIIRLVGTPEWMISFGDLMSCLLVFFVLLLTFSSSKPDKLMDMMGEYIGPGGDDSSQDVGDTTGGAGALQRIAVDPEEEAPMKLSNLIVSQKYNDFKDRLFRLGFKNDITFAQTEDGFFVETAESSIFNAKGEMIQDAKPLLQAMANVALSVKKELRVINMVGMPAGSDVVPFSAAVRAEENVSKIYDFLQAKYKLKDYRMSCGIGFGKVPGDRIRFLISNSIEGKAITISDITKKG